MVIGYNIKIGTSVTIVTDNKVERGSHGISSDSQIHIEDSVHKGEGCIIVAGV